jgi:restriction endonuclease S subunit
VLLDKIRKEKARLVKEGKLKKKDLEETPISEDEIPFKIPENWEWVRIGSLTNILNGFAFKSVNYTNEGIRVIRITNVQDGKIVDDDPKYYPLSEKDNIKKYLLKEGDLLMSLTGNVGRVGIIGSSLMPAALNQRVACLRLYIHDIQSYLYMYLQSEHFKSRCIASGKGMAQLNISTDWLGNYIIPLPPLAEQKRIVEKVEQLLGEIDKLKK